MGLDLPFFRGETRLDDDEIEGLLITTITTREELDEFEQQNIEEAVQWMLRRSFKPELILSEKFIKNVHKRMYGDVWNWAGQFRKTNKNIGVDKWQIATMLKSLVDDAKFWMEHKIYSPDEFAIRFKHRLVSIHCFSNGNGRHSRFMADIIIEKIFKQPMFTWGERNANARIEYLAAIKAADRDNFESLLIFARS